MFAHKLINILETKHINIYNTFLENLINEIHICMIARFMKFSKMVEDYKHLLSLQTKYRQNKKKCLHQE